MEDHFDSDLLIDEIQKRPAIWDFECPDYKNRTIKRRNWEELVEIFCEAGDSDEQKKIMGSILMKKWKGIRDNYNREYKKQTKPSGSKASNHTPYVYFKKLQFLQKSVTNNQTECNFVDDTISHSPDNQDILPPPEDVRRQGKEFKKMKMNPVDKHIVTILEKSLASKEKKEMAPDQQDDDRLFCLSLFTEIKKIPENRRLAAKIEILNAIQKAQNPLAFAHQYPISTNLGYISALQYSYPVNPGYTSSRQAPSSAATTPSPIPIPTPPPPQQQNSPSDYNYDSQDSEDLRIFT